ncbi:hypothetical protein [Bacillus mojavensis]|uniref:hypothetical protein n=1 Tax=Bacillus mojavensis TaxID=72360 RepID=UPI00227F6A46|nr:hypothetical protein [Bacillus mojavensis]MCY9090882.1 hypothetical protein [Bacillus mojavensis]
MNRLNKEQLEEIRKRAEAVEGDRWFVSDRTDVSYEYPPGSCEVHSVCMTSGDVYADFIANARQDIPALLDHIAKLQGKIDLYESYAQEYDYYAILNEMGDEDDNV